ncbi:Bacteriophage protein [Mycobacteroides abscessus subsp. abscessus]|nr:Bacteriophage protein [Mycobacteroides abscessus subsp. abscessus]
MRYVNPLRSAKTGSYAFREYFKNPGGSAYVINAIQELAAGDFEMKAYRSMKFDVGDGQPYILGEDFWLGDRVQAEIRGVVYTDQIMAIKGEGDRTTAGRPTVSFGDDSRDEDPVARGFRTIGNVANFAALLAGSGDMF